MSLRLPNPLVGFVWAAFLFPGRFLPRRGEMALAVAACAVGVWVDWVKPSPWESRAPARRALQVFGLLQFLAALSYLFALGFKGAATGPQYLWELPRWLILGGFAVYLIRHHDASVREATESAAAVSLYASWALFEAPGERTFAAGSCAAYLLLFSRSRLRFLHAAAGLAAAALWGARPGWSAPAGLLALIRRSPVLGWGPSRDELLGGGSQYLQWAARGGAVGAAPLAAGLFLLVRRLVSSRGGTRGRAEVGAFLAVVGLLLLGGPYLDSYRLAFMTAALMAAVARPSEAGA